MGNKKHLYIITLRLPCQIILQSDKKKVTFRFIILNAPARILLIRSVPLSFLKYSIVLKRIGFEICKCISVLGLLYTLRESN